MTSEELRVLRLPAGLMKFLFHFESSCVVACCGVAAFDFSPRVLAGYLKKDPACRKADMLAALDAVIARIVGLPEVTVVCDDLNTVWPKADALAFFSGLKRDLAAAPT